MAETSDPYARENMTAERHAIIACQRGSREAFGIVVSTYMRRAYRAAIGLVGNREDAMDLSQEAFVKAFRAIRRFDPDRPFYPWFLRILRNCCYDWLRKKRARPASDYLDALPGGAAGPEVLAHRDEKKVAVWNAIRRLGDRDREIIVLRHFQHLSYKEIAETLGIPEGTVMSRLFTARSRLREELKDLVDAED